MKTICRRTAFQRPAIPSHRASLDALEVDQPVSAERELLQACKVGDACKRVDALSTHMGDGATETDRGPGSSCIPQNARCPRRLRRISGASAYTLPPSPVRCEDRSDRSDRSGDQHVNNCNNNEKFAADITHNNLENCPLLHKLLLHYKFWETRKLNKIDTPTCEISDLVVAGIECFQAGDLRHTFKAGQRVVRHAQHTQPAQPLEAL
eukprot:364394-Chlamydomonas_euryale.AAC.7